MLAAEVEPRATAAAEEEVEAKGAVEEGGLWT